MIVYFADRKFNIIGKASTILETDLRIIDDTKIQEVETGTTSLELVLDYSLITPDFMGKERNRRYYTDMVQVGNYILLQSDDKTEFYTIIESDSSALKEEITIYSEDGGMDLINDVALAYHAKIPHTMADYIIYFAREHGFQIGRDDMKSVKKTLGWDNEETTMARIEDIADIFEGEFDFSFKIENMKVTKKYINVYKKHGKSVGDQLRLNYDLDDIRVKRNITNLATALYPTGGTPSNSRNPVTLKGYKYDDKSDFYVSTGGLLKSRKALARWSRYSWEAKTNKDYQGHIVRRFKTNDMSQKALFNSTMKELKKVCKPEENYEIDIIDLPSNVKLGDRISIIDDSGELYLSSRIIKLESHDVTGEKIATLGEHLIKSSGISAKVQQLADDFSKIGPGLNGEDASLLKIFSSNGFVFKDTKISTVLTVAIYKGEQLIMNHIDLQNVYGPTARLEWRYQQPPQDDYIVIPSDDPMVANNGFALHITPEFAKKRVNIDCKLIVD